MPAPEKQPVRENLHAFWVAGTPFVWLTAMFLVLILAMLVGLFGVVFANGAACFWPKEIRLFELQDGTRALGEIVKEERNPLTGERRLQVKVGNRELYGLDHRWIPLASVLRQTVPTAAVVIERMEYGNFYGFLSGKDGALGVRALAEELEKLRADEAARLTPLKEETTSLSRALSDLRLRQRKPAGLHNEALQNEEKELLRRFDEVSARQAALVAELDRRQIRVADAQGRQKDLPLGAVVRLSRPNEMGLPRKLAFTAGKVAELLTGDPREANTEGGIFPAIYGTVVLVFLMSVLMFPVGVTAGIYLKEYAKDGPLLRLVRIAINNLAGVPSIVYGMFGLAFFVYGVGGTVDRIFFPERLPSATFGTGGVLWASLTLGLLTVPVVVVSTYEALSAIPGGIREGSLAVGATRFQTVRRVLIPMAAPGIMTGLILAISRAAGEVAPLLLTGVVKQAVELPLDGEFPWLHLDRPFMHLGFHIYDVGFQSPNVDAARPMVFASTLVLLGVVVLMNSAAIILRNRMRRRSQRDAF